MVTMRSLFSNAGLARTSIHHFPMIEHALREGLPSGVGTQFTVEAERLADRKISLHGEHRRSGPLFFTENLSSALIQDTVDTADGIFRTLNFDYQEIVSTP